MKFLYSSNDNSKNEHSSSTTQVKPSSHLSIVFKFNHSKAIVMHPTQSKIGIEVCDHYKTQSKKKAIGVSIGVQEASVLIYNMFLANLGSRLAKFVLHIS